MLLLTSNIDKLHTEGAFEDTLQVVSSIEFDGKQETQGR